jgi:hypothetical protein
MKRRAKKMGIEISQSKFGLIEVERCKKKDIQIWMFDKGEINLIQVEKENVIKLIKALQNFEVE